MAAPGSDLAPDLRKRIEIMAEHIARNGTDFENTVKAKNKTIPLFTFLYGGDGSEYYELVLAHHRKQIAAEEGPTDDSAVNETAPSQRPQSTQSSTPSANLASLLHQQAPAATPASASDSSPLAQLVQRWKEPPAPALSAETERMLAEICGALEQMASRDAIRSGRAWIEMNANIVHSIAGSLVKRMPFLKSCNHRLHILYLVHDVLQTEAARKDAPKPLICGFKPYLVWILRPCFQMAKTVSASEEDKVLRLLQLWTDRSIISNDEAEEMRTLISAADLAGSGARAAPQGQLVQVPPPPPAVSSPHFASGQMRPGMQQGQASGYRLLNQPEGRQTPETIPVGLMATMLKQSVRRTRENRQEFVPYKPLDAQLTPQSLPAMESPTPRLMERLQDFYEDLEDDKRGSSKSRSSSRSSSSDSSSRRSRRSRSRIRGGFDAPRGGFTASRGFGAARGGFSERPGGLKGVAIAPPVM